MSLWSIRTLSPWLLFCYRKRWPCRHRLWWHLQGLWCCSVRTHWDFLDLFGLLTFFAWWTRCLLKRWWSRFVWLFLHCRFSWRHLRPSERQRKIVWYPLRFNPRSLGCHGLFRCRRFWTWCWVTYQRFLSWRRECEIDVHCRRTQRAVLDSLASEYPWSSFRQRHSLAFLIIFLRS